MFARRRSLRVITGLALAFCAMAVTSTDATAQRPKNELAVGDMAPSLSGLNFVQGEFSGFEHGKTYIVEFWATWCAPCRAEIPEFEEVHQEVGDEVRFVGVNVGEDISRAAAFLDEVGATYDQFLDDDGDVVIALETSAMPVTLVIDADERITLRHLGPLSADDLRVAIAEAT